MVAFVCPQKTRRRKDRSVRLNFFKVSTVGAAYSLVIKMISELTAAVGGSFWCTGSVSNFGKHLKKEEPSPRC